MRMNENEWEWMRMNENEWEWMRMNENEWEWIIHNVNLKSNTYRLIKGVKWMNWFQLL